MKRLIYDLTYLSTSNNTQQSPRRRHGKMRHLSVNLKSENLLNFKPLNILALMLRVASAISYWCHLRILEGKKVSILIEVSLTCSLPTCPLTSENRKVVRGQRGEQEQGWQHAITSRLTGQHSLETLWSANSSRARWCRLQPGHQGTSRKYSPHPLFSASFLHPLTSRTALSDYTRELNVTFSHSWGPLEMCPMISKTFCILYIEKTSSNKEGDNTSACFFSVGNKRKLVTAGL